jgi:beta-phosphoglucomutase-like phosphatase (HAD superfamily)
MYLLINKLRLVMTKHSIFLSLIFMIWSQVMQSSNTIAESYETRTFKAVIFDLDGTILDTERLWLDANYHILHSYASHLDQIQKDEIITQLSGLSLHENWRLLQRHCSVSMSIEEIGQKKSDYVRSVYETAGIAFIPYFEDFHDKVEKYGLKHAIATNSSQAGVDKIVSIVPLHHYFAEHIYTIDRVHKIFKPQPDIFLYVANRLGVQPQDCIVIEDSFLGIAAAKAAGMYCIAINTGKNRDLLWQADEIVECYREIDLDRLLKK